MNSHMSANRAEIIAATKVEKPVHNDPFGLEIPLLVTTKTCPNCKMAKIFLDKAGIDYEVVYADDNPETAAEFEIKQAPTMVVSKNGETEVITNVSNIRKFAEMNS